MSQLCAHFWALHSFVLASLKQALPTRQKDRPSALSSHPFFRAIPKRGFSFPTVPKKIQDESHWTIFCHMVIPVPIPKTVEIECTDWIVLGYESHTLDSVTPKPHGPTVGRSSSSEANQGVVTRNSFRAGTNSGSPLNSLTFCRTHLGRYCTMAFTSTSYKILDKIFLRKGWKCTLKRTESLWQFYVISIHPSYMTILLVSPVLYLAYWFGYI